MTQIGIGTLAWGDEKCGFGTSFRESGLKETFAAAAEGGINFIDTAEVRSLNLCNALLDVV